MHRQSYPLVVPVVEACEARECVREGAGFALATPEKLVPLSPLLPSGGQAAAIAPELATAEVFYAGQGDLAELRGHDLAHRFIALEVSSPPTAWRTAASLGAAAIVFLGDSHTTNTDLLNKATTVPVGIPRFYCDDADAVARIRCGKIAALRLHVRVHWEERFVANILCLIPGRQKEAAHDSRWTNQLVILQSRYDAASQVITSAPGATQAMNAGVLLDLAEKIAAAPNHCSVLIAFTAGDQWNLRGSRAVLDLLNREQKDSGRAVAQLESQHAAALNRLAIAERIARGLSQLSVGDHAGLTEALARTALENQLLREASGVEEKLQRARLNSASAAIAAFKTEKDDVLSTINFLHVAGSALPSASQSARLKDAAMELLPAWNLEVSRLTSPA